MKLPIPDDWDGASWRCVQIQWPDSELYLALLRGFLTQFTRGRFWDEKSGIIKDAQAIGWDLFDKNWPFVACQDSNGNGNGNDNGDSPVICGGITIEGEEDMGQVVTEIKIVDGKLRVYYGHCCYDDLDVGALGGDDMGIDDAPYGDEGEFSACGKATAAIEKLYAVAASAWSCIDEYPWEYIPIYSRDHPDLSGGNQMFINCVVTAIQLDIITDEATVFQDYEKAELICWLVARLEDDETGMTSDDYNALLNKIEDYFGLLTLDPVGAKKAELFKLAAVAIGPGDFEDVTALGANVLDGNCDCPEEPIEILPDFGEGMDWVYVFDFREATLHPNLTLQGNDPQHAPGEGLWAYPGETDDQTQFGVRIALDNNTGTASLKQVGMVWLTRGDENWNDATDKVVGTENDGAIYYGNVVATCGENPSQAGTWQLVRTCNLAIQSGEPDQFMCDIFAYHPPDTNPPDEIQYSTVLIALGFAGTGDPPLDIAP